MTPRTRKKPTVVKPQPLPPFETTTHPRRLEDSLPSSRVAETAVKTTDQVFGSSKTNLEDSRRATSEERRDNERALLLRPTPTGTDTKHPLPSLDERTETTNLLQLPLRRGTTARLETRLTRLRIPTRTPFAEEETVDLSRTSESRLGTPSFTRREPSLVVDPRRRRSEGEEATLARSGRREGSSLRSSTSSLGTRRRRRRGRATDEVGGVGVLIRCRGRMVGLPGRRGRIGTSGRLRREG